MWDNYDYNKGLVFSRGGMEEEESESEREREGEGEGEADGE